MGMPGGTTDSTHPHKHRRHCGRTAPHVLLFTTQRSRLHIAQTHTRLSTATSTASTHHTPAGNTVTAQLRVRVHRVRPPPAAQHARAVVRRVQRAVRQALRLPERPDANRPDGTTPPAHSTAAKRHGRRRRLLRVLRQSVREGHREVRRRARARVCAARIALLLIVLATPAQEKYFIPSVVKEMCKTAYPIREVCSSLHTQACPCTSLRSLCCLPRCTALPYCLLFHFHCPSSSILSCVLRYIPLYSFISFFYSFFYYPSHFSSYSDHFYLSLFLFCLTSLFASHASSSLSNGARGCSPHSANASGRCSRGSLTTNDTRAHRFHLHLQRPSSTSVCPNNWHPSPTTCHTPSSPHPHPHRRRVPCLLARRLPRRGASQGHEAVQGSASRSEAERAVLDGELGEQPGTASRHTPSTALPAPNAFRRCPPALRSPRCTHTTLSSSAGRQQG